MTQDDKARHPENQLSSRRQHHDVDYIKVAEPKPTTVPVDIPNGKGQTSLQVSDQAIKEDSKQVSRLSKKVIIGGSAFIISYSSLIFSGTYSIHYALRLPDKRPFSIKLDDRDPTVILRDREIRSKLIGFDLPEVIDSECRNRVSLTVMEPISMTFKTFMLTLSKKKDHRLDSSAVLLRMGRMCLRLLKRLHENGILHGNINPHTFVLLSDRKKQGVRPDIKRGPIIADFSHAIDYNADPLYTEKNPNQKFNSALYSKDGGIYTKRDDMENLAYLLLFLASGHISWESRRKRDELIFGKKCLSELEKSMKGMPLVIKNYLAYIRTVKWNDTPDYELLDRCLINKDINIRMEIRTRKERLSLIRKRKRESVAHHRFSADDSKVPRVNSAELTNVTPSREVGLEIDSVQSEESSSEAVPEYVQVSLQMMPNVVLEFSELDNVAEKEPSSCFYCLKMHESSTTQEFGALCTYGDDKENERANYGRPDPFPIENLRDSSQKRCEKNHTSMLGSGGARVYIDENVEDRNVNIKEDLQVMLSAPNLANVQTDFRSDHELIHCDLRQISRNHIQFQFPFLDWENDKE